MSCFCYARHGLVVPFGLLASRPTGSRDTNVPRLGCVGSQLSGPCGLAQLKRDGEEQEEAETCSLLSEAGHFIYLRAGHASACTGPSARPAPGCDLSWPAPARPWSPPG